MHAPTSRTERRCFPHFSERRTKVATAKRDHWINGSRLTVSNSIPVCPGVNNAYLEVQVWVDVSALTGVTNQFALFNRLPLVNYSIAKMSVSCLDRRSLLLLPSLVPLLEYPSNERSLLRRHPLQRTGEVRQTGSTHASPRIPTPGRSSDVIAK